MTGSIAALAGTMGVMAGALAMPEINSNLAPFAFPFAFVGRVKIGMRMFPA
jgi:hypothetical protein